MTNNSFLGRLFDGCNYVFLTLLGIATLLPFVYVVVSSFSNSTDLIPTSFSFDAYAYIFSTATFPRSMLVSVYITIVGTAIHLVLASLMAYALSHTALPGRSIIMLLVVFTMIFNGGMIPTYFVVEGVGLTDTLWALMIPNALSAFNLIILKSFFQSIPNELKESAKMDGAHEIRVLTQIVLPLSLPALAALGLFHAVGLWNQYFNAILYINDSSKWPVQVLLRQVVILSQGAVGESGGEVASDSVMLSQGIKMAVIVVSIVPIMLVYPFLQKHFAKGVLLGSVKG
ncbi:carbohydrate ABC transporter permease [Aureibacillus halotolerans]|uniref:Putative aldouronate transport system permease protein n=1 Tax=Aureibacillus halotolerans TaxID=1508390 RepID=A0A4R6UAI5_9BACI|nr:carbohydrate ABC transporter permease [Aureibacillus halotolerans]TDQ42892.1 putative aldouronate transport system permease protein [Aureibacillus halotolerans]